MQALAKICFDRRLLLIVEGVFNLFRDCGQHILAIIVKDRASIHFGKHRDDLFETCESWSIGYGLEIPVQYRFIGPEKAVEWAEKNIRKVLRT